MNVNKTITDSGHFKFSFKINNFTQDVKDNIDSDVIYFHTAKWRLRIMPKSSSNDLFVSILLRKESGEKENIKVKLSIIGADDNVVSSREETFYYSKHSSRGWNFCSRSDFFNTISAYNYSFTIVCEMKLIVTKNFKPYVELKFPEELRKICCTNFHDLKIQLGDKTILAHRFLLSTYSPIFLEKILKLKDSSAVLEINDLDYETLEEIINFVYEKEFKLTEENVKQILLASELYKILELQKICENFIFKKLTVENALETFVFAKENHIWELRDETFEYINKNIHLLLKMQKQWKKFVSEHPVPFKTVFEDVLHSLSMNSLVEIKQESNNPKLSENSGSDHNANIILSSDLEKLYETMEFSDVEFAVEEKILKAHKNILSCRSTVFQAMFKHDTLESKENIVKIADFDYETMSQLLKYIYCGKTPDLEKNPWNLFSAADKYNLMELKNCCTVAMEENITVENVTKILKLADLHSCLSEAKEKATKFLRENFEEVFDTEEWDAFAENNSEILNNMFVKWLESEKSAVDSENQ